MLRRVFRQLTHRCLQWLYKLRAWFPLKSSRISSSLGSTRRSSPSSGQDSKPSRTAQPKPVTPPPTPAGYSSEIEQQVEGDRNQAIGEVKDDAVVITNVGRDVYILGVRPKCIGNPLLNRDEIAEPGLLEPEQDDSQDIDALVQEVRSRAYADIKKRTGTMQMLRVNHPVPVTDIYVDLNILQRVSGDFSFSEWRKEFKGGWYNFDRLGLGRVEQERVSALEKIRNCRRLIVLGKPGAGKSTLLKTLATACIEGKLAWDEPEYVPVFVTLREFAEDAAEKEKFNLRDAIQQQFNRWGVRDASESILKQGRALILLDGLDEVPTRQSEFVVLQMRRFCLDYTDNRFIITCRTQSLKFHFEGFTEAESADFTFEQVERFIKNWFAVVVANDEAGELAQRLIWQLQENESIAELAVTPILLNLTCSVFWDERGKLPAKRADLYKKGLRDLLERWDLFRGIQRDDGCRPLTLDEKEYLLAQMAYRLFEDNDYFPEQHKLEYLIANYLQIQRSEAEQVLRSLEAQHGLIIERSEGYFSFSHLTFQEYFAAKYIVDSSTHEAALQRLFNYITQPRWRELFLLVVEILPSADKFLQLMKQQVDLLVANDEKLQLFLFWIFYKSNSVNDDYYKPVAIRVFYLCLEYIFGLRLFDIDDVIDLADRFHVHVQNAPFGIRSLDIDLELYRLLDFSNCSWFSPKDALAKYIEDIFKNFKLNPNLKCELQQLKHCLSELPDPDQEGEKFQEVWAETCPIWAERLSSLMNKYCNISHDWQFSEEQIELLRQYYDANELLLKCLGSNHVSLDVKQEIEKTLLLPSLLLKSTAGYDLHQILADQKDCLFYLWLTVEMRAK